MISISLCMIVKNEEKNLDNCLNSTKNLFDEIIIVDTGSSDNTKDIAKKYTDKIYDFKWCNDFAKARNFSFSKATKDYIMWLDADDIILENDLEKLLDLKKNFDTTTDIIMIKYNMGIEKDGSLPLSYYRERIFKRDKKYTWISPIHETITPTGKVTYLEDISITHNKKYVADSKRNLMIFEEMKKNNIYFDARQTFYYARELYYNKEYEKAIENYNKFFNMPDAWKENKISACIDLHYIYLDKKDISNSLECLFKSFEFDLPRSEVCCHIGNIFMNKNEYSTAIYWYTQATQQEYDISSGGFFIKDYYDFIPYIQLCVCYYNIGNMENAILYNDLAGKIKPTNQSYLHNISFFKSQKLI